MDAVLDFLANELWFVALVNLISIVGFVITLWVLIDVKNIKSYYVFKGRVPQHTKKLKGHAKNLVGYMNDFEGMLPEIELELVSVEVELESLAKKLDRKSRRSIDELLTGIGAYVKEPDKDVGKLRNIHRDLHRVIEHVEAIQQDLNWEK